MDVTELLEEVRGLRADVREIREDLEHYRGFVAGVVWCFSGLAALAGFVWGALSGN